MSDALTTTTRRFVATLDANALQTKDFQALGNGAQNPDNADTVYIKTASDLHIRFSCTLEAREGKVFVRGSDVAVLVCVAIDAVALQLATTTTEPLPDVYVLPTGTAQVVEIGADGLESWRAATTDELTKWAVPPDVVPANFQEVVVPRLKADRRRGCLVFGHTPQVSHSDARELAQSKAIYKYLAKLHNADTRGAAALLNSRAWALKPLDGVTRVTQGAVDMYAMAHPRRASKEDKEVGGRIQFVGFDEATKERADGTVGAIDICHMALTPKCEATATRRKYGRGRRPDAEGQASLYIESDDIKNTEGLDSTTRAKLLVLRYDALAAKIALAFWARCCDADNNTVKAAPSVIAPDLGMTYKLGGTDIARLNDGIAVVEAMSVSLTASKTKQLHLQMFDRVGTVIEDGNAYYLLKPNSTLWGSTFDKRNKGRGTMFFIRELLTLDTADQALEFAMGLVACEEHANAYGKTRVSGSPTIRKLGYWARQSNTHGQLSKLLASNGRPALKKRIEQLIDTLNDMGLGIRIEWAEQPWDSRVRFTAPRLALAQEAVSSHRLDKARAHMTARLEGKDKPQKRGKTKVVFVDSTATPKP